MLVKPLKLRLYQEELLDKASKKNTLIVLPTGLGKTFIALALSVLEHDKGKIVFTAPTRPLVEQHKQVFDDYTRFKSVVATGLTPPKERRGMYENANVIFCTPQTIENDVISGRFDLKKVSLFVFDEAHRAVGDYSYVFLAKQYARLNPTGKILAMTASPGKNIEGISAVCKNLNVQEVHAKNIESPTVKPYVQDKEIIPIIVELPFQIESIRKDLERTKALMLEPLKRKGLIKNNNITKKNLLDIQKQLWDIASSGEDPTVYSSIKEASAGFKAIHSLELIETKGPESLKNYMKKIFGESRKVKSSASISNNTYFRNAYEKTLKCKTEHPKITRLKELVKEQDLKKSRIIVFSNLRDVSKELSKKLNTIPGVRASEFLGQKEGMTQRKQLEILKKFREGELNVIVATQVIHEGIHVSDADVGIFFEPLPSAIQNIQRKGRIGRTRLGRIYVLMTKGCVDEKHYWAGKWNEKKTIETIDNMSKKRQTSINNF